MCNRIYSCLDHCIGNVECLLRHGECLVQYLLLILSDHSPLLVRVKDSSIGGGRPFRFFNCLVARA